jgi:hypothetical protein
MLPPVRCLSTTLVIMLCAALWTGLAWAQPAPGQGTPRQQSEQMWADAERAWQDLRFAEALDRSKLAASLDPSAPFAPAAQARVRWLHSRSEGAFVALAAVEKVRRDPSLMSNPAAIEELFRASQAFPPGLVRVEAWLLVADAGSRLLQRPELAIAAWGRVLDEPAAAAPEKAIALGGLVGLHLQQDDRSAALQVVRRYPDVAPNIRARVERLARRALGVRASIVVLLAVAATAFAAGITIARRQGSRALRAVFPWYAFVFGAYLAAGGATMAWAYDREGMLPFVVLGAGSCALLFVARACNLAWPSRPARAGSAALVAVGVLALSILALLASPPLAEGFGL